jgi:hypothetical protein
MDGCIRRAWLVLGSTTLPLEDADAGYSCSGLDLGYPDVRDVVNNRPDTDGVDDRTALMGARAVTANIKTTDGGDPVSTIFAPFMGPALRPELHYVLDRPGAPERVLTVRASGYSWPISGSLAREVQLAWVAADPVIRSALVHTATAWSGSGTPGRVYNLKFDRVYPAGSASPVSGTITTDGDVAVQPYLRIFGPITAPVVSFLSPGGGGGRVALTSITDAGHFVGIDTRAHTAFLDDNPALSVLSSIDWTTLVWPKCPPLPAATTMTLDGTGTSSSSQVQATWRDGYLT